MEPVAHPAGKQTASTLSFRPRWSASPACLRRPCGPSVTITAGMPSRSIPCVCQKSEPEQRLAFSSNVIWPINAFKSRFIFYSPCLLFGNGIVPRIPYLLFYTARRIMTIWYKLSQHDFNEKVIFYAARYL